MPLLSNLTSIHQESYPSILCLKRGVSLVGFRGRLLVQHLFRALRATKMLFLCVGFAVPSTVVSPLLDDVVWDGNSTLPSSRIIAFESSLNGL